MPVEMYFRDRQTGEVLWCFPIDANGRLSDPERYERLAGPEPERPVPMTTQGQPIPQAAPVVAPPAPEPATVTTEPCIKSCGFGKYHVFKADGSKANEKALTKDEAVTLLATLTAE